MWAANRVQIAGKASVQQVFASLEDFFMKGLSVQKPDLQMHIQALKDLSKSRAPLARIKDAMDHISQLKPAENSLKSKLQNANIFPVKQRNNETSMTSLSVDFSIVDKPRYRGIFDGRVHLLDFSEDDFWRMQHFLIACGLQKRFMSVCVEEQTAVEDAIASPTLTKQMQTAAYAFLR